MGSFKDLTGMKFGRLTAIDVVGKYKNGAHLWRCRCDCGDESVILATSLLSGNTRSCGCLLNETRKTAGCKNRKHGLSYSWIHRIWDSMKKRCNNPNCKSYKDYGGRGIKVCDRWLNSFENFYADVSKLPHFGGKGYSLDRIDNDGDYCPENVRWADKATQNRNKRNNIWVEYQGVKMILADAAKLSGILEDTLKARIQRGETGEYLFRLPVVKNHK